ncbi:glycoside hydrolase family 3 N-terminal domain-containing protein [Corynebacterium breve]|uniref:beta-N-acetylhexosaminidase n=1 Tax=Corynebacterium breve TaxID=3049799 RepID=A0ABY8VEF4_9CORY|nr:glycoside hydrolase family 3 N-terminal domain-containing protein [Corynebacterium breve]WIM67487.1 glycoside hydrolase family 3 N-terminal domain-containing protein [Corynebacterium breve]
MKRTRVLGAFVAVALLSACTPETAEETTDTQSPGESATSDVNESSSVVGSSTVESSTSEEAEAPELREQVASLMVVGVTDYDSALAALELGVGGIIVPSWADSALFTEDGRNIHALREQVGRPFTVSIDFEGGRVQRHTNVFGEFPSPRDMAAMSPEEVRAMAHDIGTRLKEQGVTVDYAPLLDVDIAGLEIMGDRAFGTDPDTVATYAVAFAQGLVDAGVTPTFKHFPGHGQASADTHLATAVTPHLDQLKELDLLPYGEALPAVPEASVMMGHMVVPGLGETPSTINPAAYELLRSGDYPGGSPFAGAIVTDDLSGMRAITDHMSTPGAVSAAIAAGADQALWSSGDSVAEAIDTLVKEVEAGNISQSRIDEAAKRVEQQHSFSALN